MWEEASKQFQFEIGAVVAHKSKPQLAMTVVSRALTQCHGGIQRYYSTTLMHAPAHAVGGTDAAPEVCGFLLNESELIPFAARVPF